MPNPAEPSEPIRRRPKQARARATKEAIFEATIQILEGEGEAAFNTNRVAERAGVSIGTLYQYFARKEHILIELGMRETARHRANNKRLIEEGLSAREATRASMRFYINMMKETPTTRRASFYAIRDAITAQQMISGADTLLPTPKGETATDRYVLSRAIMGAVQAAVAENYKGLYGKAFEDGIIRLIEGYRGS